MHRSSESVAALAGALAKAQIELSNPEKSLSATIRSDRHGEGDRTFRYATLASGLDIVRKTLGKHELAVVQTTAVDQPTGLVNLTTMLAHSSGEWISSDWPVCQTADIAVPHRMGAALTYARRYALFALVGIAGEDDLDAPDLGIELKIPDHSALTVKGRSVDTVQSNASSATGSGEQPNPGKRFGPKGRRPTLNPEKSAAEREQLIQRIAELSSPEEATHWARAAIPVKNQLTTADAGLVEQAFGLRIATLTELNPEKMAPFSPTGTIDGPVTATVPAELPATTLPEGDRRERINGLDRALPRRRDKGHLKYVAAQACLVCGRQPSDPHHLRFAQAVALGRKVSDEFTVPLCRSHHREVHRSNNEKAWWTSLRIEPLPFALRLWRSTHEADHVVGFSADDTSLTPKIGQRSTNDDVAKAD